MLISFCLFVVEHHIHTSSRVAVYPIYKTYFSGFSLSLVFVFFVPSIKKSQSPMNIFYLIFSGLLDLDPLPVFLCYEYITRRQRKIILFGGKTQDCTAREWRIRMAEEGPQYYQRVLSVSSFWKRVKVGHSFIILCQSWQL